MATTKRVVPSATPEKSIAIPPRITVRELAVRMHLPVTEVLGALLKSGILSSQNEPIDFDTASIVAQDLGFATTAEEATAETVAAPAAAPTGANAVARPPVIVVLGHVDHGKTMLLDTIRSANVVAGEAGGITQHIGAYQVVLGAKTEGKKKRSAKPTSTVLTFIDTPGHEAFTAMRSRGAKVADLGVLVVAADDGVKPQTVEAITILKAAGIPFVVAANKMDRPEANLERVKQDLAKHDVASEDYGGKTIVVPISAKTGDGIDTLLETLALLAEVEHGKVKADPTGPASGTIIESHLDPGEGPVATVLVQSGTLRVGDLVAVGSTYGKVKALKDDRGTAIAEAPPSYPARILGLKGAPVVGDVLRVTDDVRDARKKSKRQNPTQDLKPLTSIRPNDGPAETKLVNVVVKADTLGSLEAIAEALNKLAHPEVRVDIVHSGLGNITEADVLRASTSDAQLLGFHVAVTPAAKAVAKGKDFPIETYTVIYDLIESVRAVMEKTLKPEVYETTTGSLTLLATFRAKGAVQIVGGRVDRGTLESGATVRIRRGDALVGTGTLTEVRQGKTVVKKVDVGSEAGLKVDTTVPLAKDDVLEVVRVEERARTLDATTA